MHRKLSLNIERVSKLLHTQRAEATIRVICYINTFGEILSTNQSLPALNNNNNNNNNNNIPTHQHQRSLEGYSIECVSMNQGLPLQDSHYQEKKRFSMLRKWATSIYHQQRVSYHCPKGRLQ